MLGAGAARFTAHDGLRTQNRDASRADSVQMPLRGFGVQLLVRHHVSRGQCSGRCAALCCANEERHTT